MTIFNVASRSDAAVEEEIAFYSGYECAPHVTACLDIVLRASESAGRVIRTPNEKDTCLEFCQASLREIRALTEIDF